MFHSNNIEISARILIVFSFQIYWKIHLHCKLIVLFITENNEFMTESLE